MDILDMNEAASEYTLNNVPSNAVALIVFQYDYLCKHKNKWTPSSKQIFLTSDKTFSCVGNDTRISLILLDWLRMIQ